MPKKSKQLDAEFMLRSSPSLSVVYWIQWRKLLWISVTSWLVESWFLASPGETKLVRNIGNWRYRIKTTVKETQRKRLLVRAIERFEKWRVHSSRNVIPLQQDINATKLFWNKRQVLELNTYLQDLLDGYNYRYNETLTMLILDLFSKQGIRDRA